LRNSATRITGETQAAPLSQAKLNRRKFLQLSATLLAGAAVLTTGHLYRQDEAGQPVVDRLQIPIKNLDPALAGLTIAFLSDFHLYPFTGPEIIRQAITLANGLNPDLILLGGDYVTREAEAIFELAPLLAQLNARLGVFAIIGNHDIWTNIEVVKTGLREAGLPVLINQGLTLIKNGARLNLAGLDDAWSGQPDLPAALANLPTNTPNILLAHEPDPADHYAQDGRVNLHLAGHSHGGQVRLPAMGPVILPYLGQKYDLGLYQVNNMWLYTNRGIGNVTEPVRYNCPPEVTEITLVGS
jgi:predicted MPP superfamily phosphohydrolase